MRRFGLVLAVAVAAMALPGVAAANHGGNDCTYAAGQDVNTSGVTGTALVIYADPDGPADGGSGTSGTAAVSGGACANLAGLPIEGGTAEVGAGDDPAPGTTVTDAYVVIDGDNQNADPLSQSDGYIGLSNYETGTARDANCVADGPDQGQAGTSNSGGCVGIDGGPWVDLSGVPVPTPMCGNTSGNTWDGSGSPPSSRDGCNQPELDFG